MRVISWYVELVGGSDEDAGEGSACVPVRSLLAARPASVSRFDRLSPVARNVNGWQPTLERIRDKYGDLTSFIEAICGHYDGVEGGGGPSADAEGPGGASPSAPSAPPTRHGEDCLLCLQEVKITQKKLTSSNCCMSEENLESFHATSEVKPGYSACWTPSHSTRSLDALIRLAHSTRSFDSLTRRSRRRDERVCECAEVASEGRVFRPVWGRVDVH